MIKMRRFFHSIGSLEEADEKRSNKSAITETKKSFEFMDELLIDTEFWYAKWYYQDLNESWASNISHLLCLSKQH